MRPHAQRRQHTLTGDFRTHAKFRSKFLPTDRDALVSKGWKIDADLKYYEAAGAKHTESAWAQRVDPILRFLFGQNTGQYHPR